MKFHLRKVLLSLLFVTGCSYHSLAQIISVVDETGEPLEMVTLASVEPRAHTTTDAQGQANISELQGATSIEIRMLGFEAQIISYQQLVSLKKVQLKSVGLSLDQVVISATRWNQSKRDVPGRITTLSAKEVKLQNPQTAADMIAATGEVFVQKSQLGGGSPMIRGFATNRVLIAVDGVRMNTAIFRSGNVQNVINVDPFTIESSEVLFGPGSVIYGSDAIGGVMNFKTREPQLSLEKKAKVSGNGVFRFSSAGTELTGHADVNVGFKKWAFVTSVSYSDFGDLKMGSFGPEEYLRPTFVERNDTVDVVSENRDPRIQNPTAYSQINVMQKLRVKPNKHWDINYTFHYSTTSPYARYDRHLQTRGGLPRYGQWSYGPQVWMMNLLDVLHTKETSMYSQLNIRFAHQQFEESRISRSYQTDVRKTQEELVHAYSLNIDLRKNLSEKHQFFYGLEGIFNDVFSSAEEEDIVTGARNQVAARYPRSNWSSIGVYLTYKYKPVRKVTLQGGIRYNHFILNSSFDTTLFSLPFDEAKLNNGAVTGSLGVVYNPTEKWSVSLNASTGFRSPNVDDIGKIFDSEPGSLVIPNADLKAEYAFNGEIGIARVFGKWLKADVGAYYTYLHNALIRRPTTINGQDSIVYEGVLSQVQSIQNAASAYVYGVQAGVEVKLPKGFGILSRFNYQVGEEELDDGTTSPLRHAGPWFGSTHITYSFKTLKVDFYAIYNGEISNDNMAISEQSKPHIYAQDENGLPYSPSWYTLNIKLMYQFDKNVLVSTGLENLTDRRYRSYSSGIAAPGINFILSARVMF